MLHHHRSRSALASFALLLALAGCGSDDKASPVRTVPTTSSATTTSGPTTTVDPDKCISRMPGQILSEAEAVVRFNTSKVCPGYVTIKPGTKVTFENRDSAPHRVTIITSDAAATELAGVVVNAGQSWVRSFDDLGVFAYKLDAIPSFRGTVEVTDGTSSAHG